MQLTSFEIHPLYWVKGRNLIYVRDRFPGGSDSKEPAYNTGGLGWTIKKAEHRRIDAFKLNYGAGEDS